MCDNDTLSDNERALSGGVNRRQFGMLSSAAALGALLPAVANARSTTESEVMVKTPDGTADAYFVHPSTGKHPAVLIWPDIFGLRPAFRLMGKRLAETGYSVLVVNPYYRRLRAPVQLPNTENLRAPENWELLMPLARSLTPTTNALDAKAFVSFLDKQASVDTTKQIGTTGYCMGGPMVLRTAAAVPERIGAAASFHGGRLATDDDSSPHLLIPKMQAGFLIAVAQNDDEKEPETRGILRKAFDQAELDAEIEVYEDALHGWCPPDSMVYNLAAAERAWTRLLVLFEKNLS